LIAVKAELVSFTVGLKLHSQSSPEISITARFRSALAPYQSRIMLRRAILCALFTLSAAEPQPLTDVDVPAYLGRW